MEPRNWVSCVFYTFHSYETSLRLIFHLFFSANVYIRCAAIHPLFVVFKCIVRQPPSLVPAMPHYVSGILSMANKRPFSWGTVPAYAVWPFTAILSFPAPTIPPLVSGAFQRENALEF